MPPPPPRAAPRSRAKPKGRKEGEDTSGEGDLATPPGRGRGGSKAHQRALGMIGRRVLRNWPEEGGWHEAIVTDYDAGKSMWVLAYNLGNAEKEKWEDYNLLESDPEKMILTDDTVDIKTYTAPLEFTCNPVAPAAAFSTSDFNARLEFNATLPRSIAMTGLKVELEQRKCSVEAEIQVLDYMDKQDEEGRGTQEALATALEERFHELQAEENRIRGMLEHLIDT